MIITMKRNFGNYIRSIRLKKGGRGFWSLSAVAKRADISHSYLSQLEHDKHMASPKYLARLALALQVPVEELFRNAGFLPPESDKKNQEMQSMLADKEFVDFYKRYTKLSVKGQELLREYERFLQKKFSS